MRIIKELMEIWLNEVCDNIYQQVYVDIPHLNLTLASGTIH